MRGSGRGGIGIGMCIGITMHVLDNHPAPAFACSPICPAVCSAGRSGASSPGCWSPMCVGRCPTSPHWPEPLGADVGAFADKSAATETYATVPRYRADTQ
jgi:hypothetical protein